MKKAPNNTMLQNNINRLCENQKMIKLIAIFELPDDFKGGHADCKIYEDKGKHRIFDRIVYLDKMPKLKVKTDKKVSEYIDYLVKELEK